MYPNAESAYYSVGLIAPPSPLKKLNDSTKQSVAIALIHLS
jgi:hypothetical protein